VIDPGGRVVASLPSFQQGVLSARFDYLSETTWFTRFGEWFWWLSLVVTAGLWFAGGSTLPWFRVTRNRAAGVNRRARAATARLCCVCRCRIPSLRIAQASKPSWCSRPCGRSPIAMDDVRLSFNPKIGFKA
jgi:hypothetical protein